MAGPYQDKTGITPSVDEITQAGLGASVDTTTTGGAPSIPGMGNPARGLDFQVQQPSWVSPPSNEDFGQRDTRKDNYDTGLVVTPQQGFPFPALANRQTENQKRKDALAKKVADFNLYGGVGKAHDRYQTAFNQYATSEMDQGLRDQAEARFGGDMNAAREWAATTPEGQEWWHRLSGTVEAVGQENKATVQDSINTLAKVTGEGFYVPPDKLKMVVEHANAIDHNGMPVKGQGGPGEFLDRVRGAEATMQEIQYVQKVLDPVLKDAFSTTTGFDIGSKKVGGKYVLTETETKSFHDAIDQAIEMNPGYVEAYYGGDKEKAKAGIEEYYPISVKETVKLESPFDPSGSSSGSGPKGAPTEYVIDQTQLPVGAFRATDANLVKALKDVRTASHPKGYTEDEIAKEIAGRSPGVIGQSYPSYALFDITSEQGRTAQPRPFTSGNGTKHIVPTRVMNINGKLFIIGKEARESGSVSEDPTTQRGRGVSEYQDYNNLPDAIVPYAENKGRLAEYFPWIDDTKLRGALGANTSSPRTDAPSDIDALLEKYK